MTKRTRKWVRIVAVILALLLVGGVIASSVISSLAEDAGTARDSCEITAEYLEDAQALHIRQRLVYHERTGISRDRVLFTAAPNLFRRQSALPYGNDTLGAVFPEPFAPSGLELLSVRVDGNEAEWGYEDADETVLRVACDLPAGGACVFEFELQLLLSRCRAMTGVWDTDVRLSAFYLIPGVPSGSDWLLRSPLEFTRWLTTTPADYDVSLSIPAGWTAVGTGTQRFEDGVWRFEARNVREFAVSFGRRWRDSSRVSGSGVRVRALTNVRGAGNRALSAACEAIDLYGEWLGAFPLEEIELVQSDCAPGALNFPGVIWLPEDVWRDERLLKRTLRTCLAQQYLGLAAWIQPVSDAWLSDVPSAYLALLAAETLDGEAAFHRELNEAVLDALRITVPGGLYVSSDAALFTREEYDLVVLGRGTAVMHELRLAAGREDFLSAMRRFYEIGSEKELLEEMDLVRAFDEVTGGSWESFITEWLFHIDDYLSQDLEWYE